MSTTTAYFTLLSDQLQRALIASTAADKNSAFSAHIKRIAKGEPGALDGLHHQLRQLSHLDIGTDPKLIPVFQLIAANRKRFNELARYYESLMAYTAAEQTSAG
jgi:hypothetical protein